MKTNRIEVPLIFLKNNHFGIIAKINNKEACLLIDTGAGISIIHTKQVEYLGLKTDEGNIEVVVKGIGTSAHSSKNIIMSSMIIGRAEYKKPLFIDIDLSHIAEVVDRWLFPWITWDSVSFKICCYN